MKWKHLYIGLSLCCLWLVVGCSMDMEINQVPKKEVHVHEKSPFVIEEEKLKDLKPLDVTDGEYKYIQWFDWFNDSSLLYAKEEKEGSVLYTYDIFLGESQPLFKSDVTILNVFANVDHSLYFIQTVSESETAPFYVINKQGDILYETDKFGSDYSVDWNPYDKHMFLLTVYLPNWESEVVRVDVEDGSTTSLPIPSTDLQWEAKDKVAFLDWEEQEKPYEAPLYYYDLSSEGVTETKEHFAYYATFDNEYKLKVKTEGVQSLQYTFMHGNEIIAERVVPALNTYARQWWFPFYDYEGRSEQLVYFEPETAGDYYEYEGTFELRTIGSSGENRLKEMDEAVPIYVSPGGEFVFIKADEARILKIEAKSETLMEQRE